MGMIAKEYSTNIDTYNPRNYFEKWYSEVWHRRVGMKSIDPAVLEPILIEELKQAGGILRSDWTGDVVRDCSGKFKVSFKNEKDYTMFILRWS